MMAFSCGLRPAQRASKRSAVSTPSFKRWEALAFSPVSAR